MSDFLPVTIQIIGELPEAELDGFILACEKHSVSWDGFSELRANLHDHIIQDCQGNCLELYEPSQPFGDFKHLREFCHDHFLTYQQITEPGPGYDGIVRFWEPGLENVMVLPMDMEKFILVRVEDVLNELQGLADEGVRDEYVPGRIERWLREKKSFEFFGAFMITENVEPNSTH